MVQATISSDANKIKLSLDDVPGMAIALKYSLLRDKKNVLRWASSIPHVLDDLYI